MHAAIADLKIFYNPISPGIIADSFCCLKSVSLSFVISCDPDHIAHIIGSYHGP